VARLRHCPRRGRPCRRSRTAHPPRSRHAAPDRFDWLSWQILDIEQMYVGLIAALLGVLLNFLMDEVERRLLPYRRGT